MSERTAFTYMKSVLYKNYAALERTRWKDPNAQNVGFFHACKIMEQQTYFYAVKMAPSFLNQH